MRIHIALSITQTTYIVMSMAALSNAQINLFEMNNSLYDHLSKVAWPDDWNYRGVTILSPFSDRKFSFERTMDEEALENEREGSELTYQLRKSLIDWVAYHENKQEGVTDEELDGSYVA